MSSEYLYDLDTYMIPLWDTELIVNETLMFVANEDGVIPPAPLLYKPDEVISVRSFDMSVMYELDRDYRVTDGGLIALTDGSRIPSWSYDEYYPTQNIPDKSFRRTGGGYIAFGENDAFFKTQVAVTYRHSDSWKGVIPKSQCDKLARTYRMLRDGQPTRIVYFGDSITTGANSSMTLPPYAPKWTELTTEFLRRYYAHDSLSEVNTAVGGTASKWGAENAVELVSAHSPDVVVLAFGANDIRTPPEVFADNIRSIIDTVRRDAPDTEFILVSPWRTNREVEGFYGLQYTFESALLKLSGDIGGTCVVPVWSIHSRMLERKRYYDMSGNNVNHPNDFTARMYARAVAAALIP